MWTRKGDGTDLREAERDELRSGDFDVALLNEPSDRDVSPPAR